MAEPNRVLRVLNPAALKMLCGVLIGDNVPFTCIPLEGQLILLHPDGVSLPPETRRYLQRLAEQDLTARAVDKTADPSSARSFSAYEDIGLW
jgi:hypothetical protein